MVKTVYLNIEDDVPTIVRKVAGTISGEVVLVFPKRSFIFSDPNNLYNLKRQTDVLGKYVYVLTMDELGQIYARDAGFTLRSIHNASAPSKFSDIKRSGSKPPSAEAPKERVYKQEVAKSIKMPKSYNLDKTPVRTQQSSPFLLVNEKRVQEPEKSSLLADIPKRNPGNKPKSKRKFAWKLFLGFFLPILLVVSLVVVFVLPQGRVVVYPRSENVIRDLEINASSQVTTPDIASMLMPAKRISKTFTLQSSFESNGKREVGTKAAGKIRIINLSGKTLNLRASTTVLTLGNKNYTFTQDQNYIKSIPPSQLQSGNYTAHVADITAQNGGEDYNVPAGTRLEITNQVLGSQPQVLYAKTETAVLGGTSRFLSVISEEDYKSAQNVLLEKMADQFREELKAERLELPEKAFSSEIIEFIPDKIVNTESPSFSASLKATLKGLAISKDELDSLVESRIIKSLPENEKLVNAVGSNLTMKANSLNLEQGLMMLGVHVEAKSTSQVNLDGFQEKLLGRDRKEVSDILLQRPEIEKVDVILSPYWQKSMPKFATKIKIEIAD